MTDPCGRFLVQPGAPAISDLIPAAEAAGIKWSRWDRDLFVIRCR